MLAALLLPVAVDIKFKSAGLQEHTEAELRSLHKKYKGLIKWISRKSQLGQLVTDEVLDKIEKDDIILLRNLLNIDDEEALILILIATESL